MMHRNRQWCLYGTPGATVEDAREMAEKLGQGSWTLCTSFQFRDTIWINDSTSEGAIQEYAVIRRDFGPQPLGKIIGRQVETITVGWCNVEELLKYITDFGDGNEFMPFDVVVKVDDDPQHRCQLCA